MFSLVICICLFSRTAGSEGICVFRAHAGRRGLACKQPQTSRALASSQLSFMNSAHVSPPGSRREVPCGFSPTSRRGCCLLARVFLQLTGGHLQPPVAPPASAIHLPVALNGCSGKRQEASVSSTPPLQCQEKRCSSVQRQCLM